MSSWALLVALLAVPAAGQSPRKALMVSSRLGRPDQPALRYPGADADRVSAVLTELGEFEEPLHVRDGARSDVLDALKALRASAPFELFVFYYSGHGDTGGLWLGDSYLATDEMLAAIREVPAALRIVILDSCQSGGATRHKGVTLAPPVEVRIDQRPTEGNVLIASSSAEEASFESETAEGAIFTLQWVSGLRGAADEDDDGHVTLSEAYRYASVRTLGATLLAAAGPQRPTFHWDLTGHSEPVLTRASTASRLTVQADEGGSFFVFDAADRHLLAELGLGARQSGRLSLKPGEYVVRARGGRELRTARIHLVADDDRVLDQRNMPSAPVLRLAKKGTLGEFAITAAVGPTLLSLADMTTIETQLGLEFLRGWVLVALTANYLSGSNERFDLSVTQRGGGGTLALLPGLTVGRVALRAGPFLGALAVEQHVTARPATVGVLLRGGVRVRVEVDLISSLALTLTGDASGLVGPEGERWAFEYALGATLGLRLRL